MSAGGSGARPAPGNPAGISKVQEVQLQVDEASNVMRDNVSQMLHNYEKAEVLEDKAGARPLPAAPPGQRRARRQSPAWAPALTRLRVCRLCQDGRSRRAPSRREPSPLPLL